MFESYIATKNIILNFTNKIKKIKCIEKSIIENSSLNNYVDNLENGEFKIALIAPFSAGKSTLINSLIGQDLLSMEITAETSVITRILYSEKIKIEIKYRNGLVEKIPSESDKELDLNSVKKILEDKTTVKGENTEDNIEEVKVFYPLEICKNNVEIVDTPGLFARYEKHKDITTKILPTVNAVVFMIDPESVGEKNFTEIIQNYVRNAESSNMEKEGKHIFFVINKIDKFTKLDIEKAKSELKVVLQDIINEPQIFEISAYYAMIGKMYFSKAISIESIRKNKKIIIPDPDDLDYTLSGRNIQHQHIPIILKESKIKTLEAGLEEYLEEKNRYLINNLSNEVKFVISESIIHKEKEIENILDLAKEDKAKFGDEITKLEEEIDTIENKYKRNIEKTLNEKIRGGICGNSITDNINDGITEKFTHMERQLIRLVEREWRISKIGINKENVNERIEIIVGKLDENLEIFTKSMVKSSFEDFQNEIKELIYLAKSKINDMKIDIEKLELEKIGMGLSNMDGYNLEGVESLIQRTIESGFSDTIINISRSLNSSIGDIIDKNTSKVEKKGFFAGIKKFFTNKSEVIEKFDRDSFRRDLGDFIIEIEEMIGGSIVELEDSILTMLERPINDVANKVVDEVNKTISNLINNKRSLMNNIKSNMKKSETECDGQLKYLNEELDELAILMNDFLDINSSYDKEYINEF